MITLFSGKTYKFGRWSGSFYSIGLFFVHSENYSQYGLEIVLNFFSQQTFFRWSFFGSFFLDIGKSVGNLLVFCFRQCERAEMYVMIYWKLQLNCTHLKPAVIATPPKMRYGNHDSFISRKNGAVIAPIRAAAEPVAVPIDLTEVGYSSHA